MYQDYDYLTSVIKELDAQIPIRKKITGLDILLDLRNLRKKIVNCRTKDDFYILARKAIDLCNDDHSNLLWDDFFNRPIERFVKCSVSPFDSVQLLESRKANQRAFTAYNNLYKKCRLRLPIKYIKGNYIIYTDFYYKGRLVKKGSIIQKVKGIPVQQFVSFFVKSILKKWDSRSNVLYTDLFYRAPSLTTNKSISMSFLKGGKQFSMSFNYYDTVSFKSVSLSITENIRPKVEYFSEGQILYIRLPEMSPEWEPWLPDTIKKIGNANILKKVIIDIRGNGGGVDDVGLDVVRALIKDTIKSHTRILANNSSQVKDVLLKINPAWHPSITKVPYLNNQKFLVVEDDKNYKVIPDANSVRFAGNIYLIQDEEVFSAAGTLTTLCESSDKLINAGSASGVFLGKGINPFIFRLPNSHLMFRIEAVTDHSNVRKVLDCFHDKVKIRRDLSLQEWLFRATYNKDLFAKEFLYNYDPVFKKILLR
ncbi:MAG: hypothetical protein JWN76_2478 [Chitinophagaceae bacterium]|nr:hypothetical protein [Chitinophagaceae bacterium]